MTNSEIAVGDFRAAYSDHDEANRTNQAPISRDATRMDVDEVDSLSALTNNVELKVNDNTEDRIRRFSSNNTIKSSLVDNPLFEGSETTSEPYPEDIFKLVAQKTNGEKVAIIDHAHRQYEPFRKEFYSPPPEIADMTNDDAEVLRLKLGGIKICGVDCPRPVTNWSHFGLPSHCHEVIKDLNYTSPTAIQAQAIPAIMSGRDVIGVAKTGSGKTIAFLLPMFRHIQDQRPLEEMEGPVAMVMTPTGELAVQIHRKCKPFLKVLGLRAVCVYGGSPMRNQIAKLKKGSEIIICTPGRMIDLLIANSGRVTNLKRITYVVLDEADRMLSMGFETQVMKIINNIRPDRQIVLFSATFPKQMYTLAGKLLRKPLEITVRGYSMVAAHIEQIVEVHQKDRKLSRLLEILRQVYSNEDPECRTLILVDHQEAADNLYYALMSKGYVCISLHEGKDQIYRNSIITGFKAGFVPIAIATSVASRGLDVKQLRLVINYDVPKHLEDYLHRAERTGRAGDKGSCITFITPEQERYSVGIYRALKASDAIIPRALEELANNFLGRQSNEKDHESGFELGG